MLQGGSHPGSKYNHVNIPPKQSGRRSTGVQRQKADYSEEMCRIDGHPKCRINGVQKLSAKRQASPTTVRMYIGPAAAAGATERVWMLTVVVVGLNPIIRGAKPV